MPIVWQKLWLDLFVNKVSKESPKSFDLFFKNAILWPFVIRRDQRQNLLVFALILFSLTQQSHQLRRHNKSYWFRQNKLNLTWNCERPTFCAFSQVRKRFFYIAYMFPNSFQSDNFAVLILNVHLPIRDIFLQLKNLQFFSNQTFQ